MVQGQLTFQGGARIERAGACRICGRALKDPKYAALGIGPICSRKGAGLAGAGDRGAPRSDWRVIESDPIEKLVWIVDEDAGGRSVTNDAEAVVAKLEADFPGYRFFYRDSMGRWDELEHEGARFTGYRANAPAPMFGFLHK
jgi:hypothetical protein